MKSDESGMLRQCRKIEKDIILHNRDYGTIARGCLSLCHHSAHHVRLKVFLLNITLLIRLFSWW